MEEKIGQCAGAVWRALGKSGKLGLAAIPKQIGADVAIANQAIGWLAREGKLIFTQEGKLPFLALTASELAAYRRESGIPPA